MSLTNKPPNSAAILASLQNNDGFLMGLHELFSLCSNLKNNEFVEYQTFFMECIVLLRSQFIKAGNIQLDNFIIILKNAFPSLFHHAAVAHPFIMSLLQSLGYEASEQKPPPQSANLANMEAANAATSLSCATPNDLSASMHNTNFSQYVMNRNQPTSFNPRMQELFNLQMQARNSNMRQQNLGQQAVQVPNNGNNNNGHNHMSVPVNMMNLPNMTINRHPHIIPGVLEDPNLAALALNPRFQNMNFANARTPNQGNVFYFQNSINRPNNYFANASVMPSMNPQNTYLINHGMNVVQNNMQNVPVRRQINQNNLVNMNAMRAAANAVNMNHIARNPMYLVNNTVPPQLMGQILNPSLTPEQQSELLAMMNNQQIMGQHQSMPTGMAVQQQVQRDQMVLAQGQNYAAVAASGVVGSLPQNYGRISTVPVERSPSNPTVPNSQQVNISMARPVSDSNKPSTLHYHPTDGDTSALPQLVQEHRRETPRLPERSELEANQAPIVDCLNLSNVPPSVVTPNVPAKSNSVDVVMAPCTVRLCNPIPACDSGPSSQIVKEAVESLTDDPQIISKIPDTTFVELKAYHRQKEYKYRRSLSFTLRESIIRTLTERAHIEVQLRCTDSTGVTHRWPTHYTLKVNRHVLGQAAQDPNLGDECFLIKTLIHRHTNLLEVECIVPGKPQLGPDEESATPAFTFIINLVLRSSSQVMLRALVSKRTLNVEKSVENVANYFANNVIDMVRGYAIVSFVCPLSKLRIRVPVRGEGCKHIQCVDFFSLSKAHAMRSQLICPICSKITSLNDLIIDGFMCNIMVAIKDQEDVSEVRITPECTWTVFPRNQPGSQYFAQVGPNGQPFDDIEQEPSFQLTREDIINIFSGDDPSQIINLLNAPLENHPVPVLTSTVTTKPPEQKPRASSPNISAPAIPAIPKPIVSKPIVSLGGRSSPMTLIRSSPSPSPKPSTTIIDLQEMDILRKKRTWQQRDTKEGSLPKDPDMFLSEAYTNVPKRNSSTSTTNIITEAPMMMNSYNSLDDVLGITKSDTNDPILEIPVNTGAPLICLNSDNIETPSIFQFTFEDDILNENINLDSAGPATVTVTEHENLVSNSAMWTALDDEIEQNDTGEFPDAKPPPSFDFHDKSHTFNSELT